MSKGSRFAVGLSATMAFSCGVGSTAHAQVPITLLNSLYYQDFSTLPSSGLNSPSSCPTGWTFTEISGNGLMAAGPGTSATGDIYSFGASSSGTENAFGTLRHATNLSYTPYIGARFQNNTGSTIASLEIAYRGEEWRLGAVGGRTDRLDFQYSLNATNLTNGTWIDVNALDFTTPNTTGTTAGSRNGNATGNFTNLSASILGLSITNGSSFRIRWTDLEVAGDEDGLAVDEFSLTARGAAVVPEPGTLLTLGGFLGLCGLTEFRRRRR